MIRLDRHRRSALTLVSCMALAAVFVAGLLAVDPGFTVGKAFGPKFYSNRAPIGPLEYLTLLEEDFSGATWPPAGWSSNGWGSADHAWAGGTPPEACHFNYGGSATLTTARVDTTSASALFVEFKSDLSIEPPLYPCWYGPCYLDNAWVSSKGDDQSGWTGITPWDNPLSGDRHGTYTLDISHSIGPQTRVQFRTVTDPYTYYYLDSWCIDDVRIFSPGLIASLSPVTTVLNQGRRLHMDAHLENSLAHSVTFEYWLDAYRPGGQPYAGNPVGLTSVTLAPGESVDRHYAPRIPRNTPAGSPYVVYLRASEAHPSVFVEESFEFEVIPAPGPDWPTEGNQENARYGQYVSGAGDVNNDTFDDLLVSAYLYDFNEVDEGRAYCFEGSASGALTMPPWITESNQDYAAMGRIASAGDVNNDGFDDILVGIPSLDLTTSDEGRVVLYHGSASGPSAAPNWLMDGEQEGDAMGHAISSAGDVNGDGFSDVIISATGIDNGDVDEGRAYVFHGSPIGLSASPAFVVESNSNEGMLGYAVSSAGDINDDGYDDIAVGVWEWHRAKVYLGSASGVVKPAAWVQIGQIGSRFGSALSSAGDVNNDGFDDLLVGALYHEATSGGTGAAFLYFGSSSGFASVADWSVESDQEYARLGNSVAGVGDVNNDGFDDILVGAYKHHAPTGDEGKAWLYLGSASGPSTVADWTDQGDQLSAHYATSLSGVGDVNNDGFDDIIIGAPDYDNGQNLEGRAYLYYGNPTGVGTAPPE